MRSLDVKLRNETLFSERTHPHRDSIHNSSQYNINRSINLRIVNNDNIFNSLSFTHSLSTANSLLTHKSLSIDFNELNWFNFESLAVPIQMLW